MPWQERSAQLTASPVRKTELNLNGANNCTLGRSKCRTAEITYRCGVGRRCAVTAETHSSHNYICVQGSLTSQLWQCEATSNKRTAREALATESSKKPHGEASETIFRVGENLKQ